MRTKDPSLSSNGSLSIAKDIAIEDGCYSALSDSPWLRIDFNGPPPSGRWIRLIYVANLFDQLARPVIRCFIGDHHHDEILPGPLFGRAMWLGYVPQGTKEIWISPTNQPGPFGFSLESIETVPTAELVWRCLRHNPLRGLAGLAAQLAGLRYLANTEFRRVLSATPLEDYAAWRNLRVRDLDLENIDLPHANWQSGPHVRFITSLQSESAHDLRALVAQLRAQPYPHWTLAVVAPSGLGNLREAAAADFNAKIITIEPDATLDDVLAGLSDNDFVAPIAPDDQIPDYAVAALAESASRHPGTAIFYGDQEFLDVNGRPEKLKLRPDWSPILGAARPYIDGAEFFQVEAVRPWAKDMTAVELSQTSETVAKIAASRQLSMFHIRRVMRSRRTAPTPRDTLQDMSTMQHAWPRTEPTARPCATIIIPTKDRIDLLESCIGSLREKTSAHEIEVIIIDNGDGPAKSRHFFAELAGDRRFRVIWRPGPFNFSKLCNDAAAEAKASTLLFLNDDTEIIDEHWLEPLLYWAQQSEVGAVGAKLLYPSGRLQHAGVVLGIDGRAGHFERMLENGNPGYFGRLRVPHEVSAVTAACLAVDKRKFDAVGGFDAVNLAVELSDIDLCLRLSERGWQSVFTPQSVLIHHESASRGTPLRPDKVYRTEHHYFRTRWMHRLRDDPYFHPALSLDRLDAALG